MFVVDFFVSEMAFVGGINVGSKWNCSARTISARSNGFVGTPVSYRVRLPSAVGLNQTVVAAMERTFIAIKPDGTNRSLIGEIISRFEKRGYKLVALKAIKPTEELAKTHYDALKSKPFFPSLVSFICSGLVIAMVWEGKVSRRSCFT